VLTRLGERDAGLKETGKAPGHMGKCSRQQQERPGPRGPLHMAHVPWTLQAQLEPGYPARYGGDSME
jgi:hypothetical protein